MQALDKNGRPLAIGDLVLIECVINDLFTSAIVPDENYAIFTTLAPPDSPLHLSFGGISAVCAKAPLPRKFPTDDAANVARAIVAEQAYHERKQETGRLVAPGPYVPTVEPLPDKV